MFLKKDKELRDKMGQNAKEHVLKNFTYEKMLDDMEDVYNKLKK